MTIHRETSALSQKPAAGLIKQVPNLLKALKTCPDISVSGEILHGEDGWAVKVEGSVLFGPSCLTEIAQLWELVILDDHRADFQSWATTGRRAVDFVIDRNLSDISFRPRMHGIQSLLYTVRLSPEIRIVQ